MASLRNVTLKILDDFASALIKVVPWFLLAVGVIYVK